MSKANRDFLTADKDTKKGKDLKSKRISFENYDPMNYLKGYQRKKKKTKKETVNPK